MSLDPKVQIGGQLALTLASLYLPGSGQAISGLAAVFAAVQAYNEQNGNPPGSVPTVEDLQAFIDDRKSKRIEIAEGSPTEPEADIPPENVTG